MKALGVFILVLAFSFSVFANDDCKKTEETKTAQDTTKAIIDFTPKQLELYGHEGQFFDTMIVVHNYGTADLKLEKVEASCSCSSGTLQQGTIKPNETGKIYISINKNGFHGNARRVEFDVYSNAEEEISSFEVIFFDKKGDK